MHSKPIQGVLAAACLACLLAAAPVSAQTTGRIDGVVVDGGGAPLPGVTVTLGSASLQGARLQLTGAGGRFRFPALPPGGYALRAALEGFTPLERTGIDVRLDRTVTLQLTMVTGFAEEVMVTGAAPAIDATSTTTGASFGEALLGDLPTGRTFQDLAFAAPGVVGGGLEDNPSIAGASAAENRYVVDGLDTTDAAFGTLGTEVPFEFVKEVEIKTGGYEAEYGGALGGVLNVITKSGGNELQGDLFGYWSDDGLQSDLPPTRAYGRALGFTEYDLGAALGGKFIEDRLWYFVAANPSREQEDYTSRGGTAYSETTDLLFYAGKLTWQLDPSHQLVASAFGDPTDRGEVGTRESIGTLADDVEEGADNVNLSYNGTLSASLFVDLSAGRTDQTFNRRPLRDVPFYEVAEFPDPVAEAGVANVGLLFAIAQDCPGLPAGTPPEVATGALGFDSPFLFNPGCRGGSFVQETGDGSRNDLRGALTWFAETGAVDHEVKGGVGVRAVAYDDHAHYPGPLAGDLFDATGALVEEGGLAGQRYRLFADRYSLIEYDQNSSGETDELALYVQDRVRLGDYLSLSVGVRADALEATGDRSDEFPERRLDFGFEDMLAPRVGFAWDVARNGRSKLYGHYGRFYESMPLDVNARAFGHERFNFFYFDYPTDAEGNPVLPSGSRQGTLDSAHRFGAATGVADDVEPMYTEELLGGFEYEVLPNVAVGVKYVERSLRNVIEDLSVDGGDTYFITNPGGTFTVNPVTGLPLDAPVFFPSAVRDYRAFELSLNKRFTNRWQLYASYVNSENEGNYGGLFRQDNEQLDPNITTLFDLPDLLDRAYGPLPNHREHQVKAYGSYLWPFRLTTGFFAEFLSGTPISQLGSHHSYGRNERFITPRGSFGTTPDVVHLDLHFEYPVTFGGGAELRLIADVFNVTDEQEPIKVDQEYNSRLPDSDTVDPMLDDCGVLEGETGPYTACPGGNPHFGQPTEFQQPRTLRLGIKLSF